MPAIVGINRQPNLSDNFRSGEIALEALLTGGTKSAIETTTYLRRNAEGRPIAFGDEHRLDQTIALHCNGPLTGAVSRILLLGNDGRRHLGDIVEPLAQGPTQVSHFREVPDTTMVHPFHYLLGPKSLLTKVCKKSLKLPSCQTHKVDSGRRGGGGDQFRRGRHRVTAR